MKPKQIAKIRADNDLTRVFRQRERHQANSADQE